MKTYSLINDRTGFETVLNMDPIEAEESRAFWKSLGWTLLVHP